MESTATEDNLLKNFYQSTSLSINDEPSLRRKADHLRSMQFFLDKMQTCKRLNDSSISILNQDYSQQYQGLVDRMDETGLDNYSEITSILTEGKQNSSHEWVSSLSLEDDKTPACVKKLLQQQKDKKKSVNMRIKVPTNKENSRPTLNDNTGSLQQKSVEKLNSNVSTSFQGGHFSDRQSVHMKSKQNICTDQQPVVIPRFGKRKQECLEENNSDNSNHNQNDKRRQINVNYGQNSNISGPQKGERKKAIIYGRPNNNNDYKQNVGEDSNSSRGNPFLTAHQQLKVDMKRSGKSCPPPSSNSLNYGATKKSLGARGSGVSGKFVPPIGGQQGGSDKKQAYSDKSESFATESKYEGFEWMKNIDPKMIELVENEIMDHGPQINWDDIAGLEFAKTTIQEIVIWPMLRPDLFTGLRGPPKGLLLFGPPGTGKTLIGKCIASQSNAQFFNISASSLTSKWVGEGEKMVRALFGVARCQQPAVIFIDEIDSLLTQRSESEHESSRRIKTEFLVQLDGATASSEDRLLVVGATNRPQELDEAARRRLVKRLYIPLPDGDARKQIVNNLMANQLHNLNEEEVSDVVSKSSGFSGVCRLYLLILFICQFCRLLLILYLCPGGVENVNFYTAWS